MKIVIFAGGLGTRLMEETEARPKPMVEIGGKPILWHIMKIYAHYGYHEFILCLGYKSWFIKQYFLNYFLYNSDLTIELQRNEIDVHFTSSESFKVTLVETGLDTKTAGRLKRVQQYIGEEEFMLTYGDGIADINIHQLVEFHHSHDKIATVTAVQPEGQFGSMQFDGFKVSQFREKFKEDAGWINGGFFVLRPQIFNYLPENAHDPYSNSKGCAELVIAAYRHSFFHPNQPTAIASVRAGNVIGGGDWAQDRLIPDMVRAILTKQEIRLRNPNAVRPWQHVLDTLYGYLLLAQQLGDNGQEFAEAWNFGPLDAEIKTVHWMAEHFLQFFDQKPGWTLEKTVLHEAHLLKLDCSKARTRLGWCSKLDSFTALEWVADWVKAYQTGQNMRELTIRQINHWTVGFHR